MNLSKKQVSAATPPSPPLSAETEDGWAQRLHAVGQALDHFGPMRDLVITVAGNQIMVTGLGWVFGVFHTGYVPVTLLVAGEMPYLIKPSPDADNSLATNVADSMRSGALSTWVAALLPAPGDRPPEESAWTNRLRAIGRLLDKEPVQLRDPCFFEVNGGFLLEARYRAREGGGNTWLPVTVEITAEDIATEMPKKPSRIGLVWEEWR
jgi:hypothetical protein